MSLDRHCTGPQLLLLTATARKEKRRGTVENAHAKKLDKSMRLCERKGGQTSPGIQGKNLVKTSAAVHWRAWKKESQQSIRQGSKQGQSRVSGHEDSEGLLESIKSSCSLFFIRVKGFKWHLHFCSLPACLCLQPHPNSPHLQSPGWPSCWGPGDGYANLDTRIRCRLIK